MNIILGIGFLLVLLLVSQIASFEFTRKKMITNPTWLLSLDKPYKYNRYVYMIFISFIWYMLISDQTLFTMYWLIYYIVFMISAIIADMLAQFLTLIYAKKRCAKQIEQAHKLDEELKNIDINQEAYNYEEPKLVFNEEEVISYYTNPTTHTAFMGSDHGLWLKDHNYQSEAVFYVEPYGDNQDATLNLEGKDITVSKLTSDNKLPFKDEKIDVLVNRYANYNKEEISRVLKQNATAIIIQHGTQNLVELMRMYIPFGIKGTWESKSCASTLEAIGFKIIDAVDSNGKIQFTDLQSLITYVKKLSPDLANKEKYKSFYLKAMSDIQQIGYFEVTTQSFLVVTTKG